MAQCAYFLQSRSSKRKQAPDSVFLHGKHVRCSCPNNESLTPPQRVEKLNFLSTLARRGYMETRKRKYKLLQGSEYDANDDGMKLMTPSFFGKKLGCMWLVSNSEFITSTPMRAFCSILCILLHASVVCKPGKLRETGESRA